MIYQQGQGVQNEFISTWWLFRNSSFKRRSAKSTSDSQQVMSLFTGAVIHNYSRRTIQHFNKQLESIRQVSSPRSKSRIFSKEVQTIKSIRFWLWLVELYLSLHKQWALFLKLCARLSFVGFCSFVHAWTFSLKLQICIIIWNITLALTF